MLQANAYFTEITAITVLSCLKQVIPQANSAFWTELKVVISDQVKSELFEEIKKIMNVVDKDWVLTVGTEITYDDNGNCCYYATDPYLNEDLLPMSLSGEENDLVDLETDWSPKYPGLTSDVLEELTSNLELLYEEVRHGFKLTESGLEVLYP